MQVSQRHAIQAMPAPAAIARRYAGYLKNLSATFKIFEKQLESEWASG